MSPTSEPSVSAARHRHRWSVTRVGVAVLLLLGVSGGGVVSLREHLREIPEPVPSWYAPYVDVTLTPEHAFEDPVVNPVDDIVLAFVVADPEDGCTPSWGAAYDLDEAATGLDLDRRIARYRQRGGDVVVSFGGVANDELAVACTDEEALTRAYRAVIDRYDVTTIDLDIEGHALADPASITRRARALATVQAAIRRAGRSLSVWLTLPVAPEGMTAAGVAVVDAMLAARVDVGGVNVMAMSYGVSRAPDVSLSATIEQSAEATRDQLDALYRKTGTVLKDPELWGKVGVTPMIGVNDEVTDVFTTADARALRRLALDRGLGRVSMWSANRDAPCEPEAVTTVLSNHCSGVAQSPLAFSLILDGLVGRPRQGADRPTETTPTAPRGEDDPATSPYPVWTREAAYPEDTKVVLHGQVFVAKWWTQGDDPAGPGDGREPNPWTAIAPMR